MYHVNHHSLKLKATNQAVGSDKLGVRSCRVHRDDFFKPRAQIEVGHDGFKQHNARLLTSWLLRDSALHLRAGYIISIIMGNAKLGGAPRSGRPSWPMYLKHKNNVQIQWSHADKYWTLPPSPNMKVSSNTYYLHTTDTVLSKYWNVTYEMYKCIHIQTDGLQKHKVPTCYSVGWTVEITEVPGTFGDLGKGNVVNSNQRSLFFWPLGGRKTHIMNARAGQGNLNSGDTKSFCPIHQKCC